MRVIFMTPNQYERFEMNPYKWLEANDSWFDEKWKRNPIKVEGETVHLFCKHGKRTKLSAHHYFESKIKHLRWTCNLKYVGSRVVVIVGKRSHCRRLSLHQYVAHLKGIKMDKYNYPDHRDQDCLNNLDENIRPSTARQNSRNRRAKASSSTGVMGVRVLTPRDGYMGPTRYRAAIFQKTLITTTDLETAILWRAAAARLLDPEFFPTMDEVEVPDEVVEHVRERINELGIWERV